MDSQIISDLGAKGIGSNRPKRALSSKEKDDPKTVTPLKRSRKPKETSAIPPPVFPADKTKKGASKKGTQQADPQGRITISLI